MNQTTLARDISCSGIGLHSGETVNMVLRPAAAGAGIVFVRTDLGAPVSIHARYDLVSDTKLGTTIRNKQGVIVATIEHLMAAFWGLGVDNAVVELDAPEVPIMDGSSAPFVELISQAGVTRLSAPRKWLRILKTIEVKDGESMARIEPSVDAEEGLSLDIHVSYDNAVVGSQKARYDFRQVTFKNMLSQARTFGFEHEVEAMRAHGLALGGSLDNAIVVGPDKILNEGGLRYRDEFVRHKALDCVGDFFLSGHFIDGHVTTARPGHAINNKLMRALMADKTAWKLVSEEAVRPAPRAAALAQAYV